MFLEERVKSLKSDPEITKRDPVSKKAERG